MTKSTVSFLDVSRLKLLFLATLCAFALAGIAQTQQSQPAQSSSPSAQQPQAPLESSAVLKVTSRLVVVDVVVVDHKGQPVNDLTADDFSILEEGKEQKISAFSFQHPEASTGGPGTVTAPVNLPPHVFTNMPHYTKGGALNVILLDSLNTQTKNQAYVREQMLKFLAKIPEGQPVAVYALGSKLRLLQDFTTDPAALKEAIKHLKDKTSPLLNNPTGNGELSLLGPGIFDAMPAAMQQQVLQFQAEQVGMQTDLRVRLTLEALSAIARTLSGFPGRKNLIWVSETFPINITPDSSLGATQFSAMRDYSSMVATTANTLTDAQVAVYPVDAKALINSSYYSVGNNNTDSMGRYAGNMSRGGGLGTQLDKGADEDLAGRSTMNDLAERTGGKAFYNRNDVDTSILKSIEDGSTYYTLAYSPDNKDWNGKFRKLTVKSKRPGTKLRYRLGYFAVDPKALAQATARENSIDLRLDFPVSTALPFQVAVNPPSEKSGNKVVINYAVDPHALSFEQQADGLQHVSILCAAAVYNQKGEAVKTDQNGATGGLKPDDFQKIVKSYMPCREMFDLPPGQYFLRVGVRDNNTGLSGSVNATLTVPPTAQAAAKPEDKKPQ